jgi:hypothetical protein
MPAPYYITDAHPDCPSRWAVVNSSGKLEACHDTKTSAISQMVAMALATDSEPGGAFPTERNNQLHK